MSIIRFEKRAYFAKIVVGMLAVLLLLPFSSQAQSAVVYGVFFYSPTCPHCQDVITNHWPGIQDEFGDQLRVLFIDVTTANGSQWMHTARVAMNIESNSVPMLIIGRDVLIGSFDIPQRAPGLIRDKLDAGGVGYPPIPSIDTLFQAVIPESPAASNNNEASGSLFADPANIAALVVLLGLVAGIGIVGNAGWNLLTQRNQRLISTMNGLFGRRMAFIGTLVGIVLVGSLVLGSLNDPVTLLISGSVLVAFILLAFHLIRSSSMSQLSNWLIPLTVAAGLLIAAYLAYVEMTLVEATCGVMGNCNVVQQTAYARILGIPVGVIGIFGYLAILTLWLVNRFKNERRIDATIFVFALAGVAFSVYLTFLEPFVIGASCVWCLTSAVVMGILLWMTAPAGWDALSAVQAVSEPRPKAR